MHCFNPRPGLATGATRALGPVKSSRQVSIRAPVSRPGRPHPPLRRQNKMCFNPRPGLATGATRALVQRQARGTVSIRAPVSRPGRRRAKRIAGTSGDVSIRAPVSRPGRPGAAGFKVMLNTFQSAPRSRDRGDLLVPKLATMDDKFQSAPRSRDRGDVKIGRLTLTGRRFNPRPGLATGATVGNGNVLQRLGVSIRAPVSRPGRLDLKDKDGKQLSVSIRAPVSRPGRPLRLIFSPALNCFNPRPGLATGATCSQAACQ